jgi:hypothetical protein|tara:strand:+ start:66 stop:338 length:273 start_codon:yes stop_codon:yes gene_type:complete
MKLYRVQARCKNIYFDKMLEAKDDKAALEAFANGVDSGEIVGADESFYGNRVYITFEEVDRDATTKVNLGETSIGVQVGQHSVVPGESNS